MAKDKSLKSALGLGEVIEFSDGTQLPCVPATLADLDDAMKHWDVWMRSNKSIQGLYVPGNEAALDAFESLLEIACRRKWTREELRAKISVSDGGQGVINYLNRFLGFIVGSTGMGEEEAGSK